MMKIKQLKENILGLNTKSLQKVTFLAVFNLTLVSTTFGANRSLAAVVDPIKPKQKQQISDYKLPAIKSEKKSDYSLKATVEVSRSTSLYDFQDGSRSDGLDVLLYPILKTPVGTFSLKETYSKNLNNSEDTANGFSDATVSYGFGAKDWDWSAPYVLTMSPSISVVVPISDLSVKKNQLQTAVSGGLAFGIRPDGLAAEKAGSWNVVLAVTAGRSFHSYEEDINGSILNKYSSNQTLSLAYALADWNFGFNYTNQSRWSYQGNIKQSYILGQEITYSFNSLFYMSLGHSNTGSVLKANGFESNIQIVDENNSGVYLTLGSTF
jgi:hypothetical protein